MQAQLAQQLTGSSGKGLNQSHLWSPGDCDSKRVERISIYFKRIGKRDGQADGGIGYLDIALTR